MLVDNIGGCFPAGHVVVIEILDQDVIDPDVLAAFLSTDAVAALATGATIQRVLTCGMCRFPMLPLNQAVHLSYWLHTLRTEVDAATAWLGSVAEARSALIQAAGAGVSVVPAEVDRHPSISPWLQQLWSRKKQTRG